MKAPITFAIAGFGSRGSTYASMAELYPEKIKVVAVADIVPEKVEQAKSFMISPMTCVSQAPRKCSQSPSLPM